MAHGLLVGWNHERCMRGYCEHFSCGNGLLPAKKVIVPVVKKWKKQTKTKKQTDTVLASRGIYALMGLLFFFFFSRYYSQWTNVQFYKLEAAVTVRQKSVSCI